ncbi:MAG: radical SAM protein [Lachnospiraceae bacterium]|jgi:pyruvate formate lyase activating enzyme|nr:radical SAM protein [Lachnospiraceae bacterium]
MSDKIIGKVHSIETFGSVDGPGIRFIAFLQGCDMRCKFCHNPDTWGTDLGEEYDASALIDKALRYKDYWGDKGGITISGGEPLLQMDFVTEFFRLAKGKGINTCIDTSGLPYRSQESDSAWHDRFLKLMQYTDLVLLDIKHIDNEVHKKLTGYPNGNIIEMANELRDIGKPVWIRHVLLENPDEMRERLISSSANDSSQPAISESDIENMQFLCDTVESLRDTATFIHTLSNVERVDILPYHTLGTFKYEKLCLPYSLKAMNPPSKKWVDQAKEILKL